MSAISGLPTAMRVIFGAVIYFVLLSGSVTGTAASMLSAPSSNAALTRRLILLICLFIINTPCWMLYHG